MGSESPSAVDTELDRDIGLVGAVSLGVGTMIAAGIFVLSGLAVSNVGAMAIVAFVIAAVVASFTAFAYAEFAAIYPESGGGYAYVANTFDTDLTYIVGWSMILGYPASAAFYLASFSDWFHEFIAPALGIPEFVPFWLSGLVVLLLLVGLNLKGTEETGTFQIVVTGIKVALIGLFLFGGLQAFDASVVRQSVVDNLDQFQQIGVTSALVFITFFGFEAIATNAEEIEEPGTNIPRAIFFSMGFVTVVYALVVTVIVIAVNNDQFLTFLSNQAELGGLSPEQFIAQKGEVSMAYAAKYFLDFAGDLGFYVIIVGALVSMLSAANATVLAGSRVKLAMARRDHLPRQFRDLHDTLNTPHRAVLLTGALITGFILFFTVLFGSAEGGGEIHTSLVTLHLGVDAIAHFADFMLLFGLIVVNFAIVYSRRNEPDVERPFKVPAVPWVPALAVLATLALLLNVEPSALVFGVIAEAVGIALWFGVIGGVSEKRAEESTPTVASTARGKTRDYRILVSVANPDHVDQLMRTAYDVAADRGGEILVMSAVALPEQTPISRGREQTADRRALVNEAVDFAERELGAIPVDEGNSGVADGGGPDGDQAVVDPDAADGEGSVPVSGLVRVAHHVDEAVVHTVAQHDCDAVLVGWSGKHQTHRRDIVLGSIVDQVAREAPCDVLVEREGETIDPESILLPTAGGPHAAYAAEVARAIANTTGASVELFYVDRSGEADDDADGAFEQAAESFADVETTRTVVAGENVSDAIVERSSDHDITVVGATREGVLQQFVFGSVPEEVGRRADSTVIMAKREAGISSKASRLVGRLRGR